MEQRIFDEVYGLKELGWKIANEVDIARSLYLLHDFDFEKGALELGLWHRSRAM